MPATPPVFALPVVGTTASKQALDDHMNQDIIPGLWDSHQEAIAQTAGNAAASQAARDAAEVFADAAADAVAYDYLVVNSAALASVSPAPSTGNRAFTRDTEHVWEYNGSAWVDLGEAPTAGKATKVALAALDGDIRERMVSPATLDALAAAGVVLAFQDRDTGRLAAWIDSDGILHAELHDGYRRLPNIALDHAPLWGCLRDGEFLGFAADGEVIGQINRALSQAGIAPDAYGHGLGWQLVFAAPSAEPVLAHRRDGGLVDLGRGRAPVIGTEWLTTGGTQVAPLTAGAVECVVAYFHSGERRVLTPPTEGLHYRAPELAYGGVSVRCWRSDGKLVAVSIERPGFVVEDDPDLALVILGDGQSLAQGSFGAPTPWPFKSVDFPTHTLTVQNTILPGDIRTGRDAGAAAYRLDAATLTGFTPIAPRTGIISGHGLTPLEAMVIQLQEDIVRLIGRPQRLIAWTGGAGGASITAIGAGTNNELNQKDVLDAAHRFCTARGWRMRVAAMRWTHGEADATMATATYVAAVNAYRDALDAHILALTGQADRPVWILAQPSSFIESVDDEMTTGTVPGMLQMMLDDPGDTVATGPGYADHTGYVADLLHMSNAGYLAQGEADAPILRRMLWGGAEDRPLYALSATIAGAVITVTWSEPIEEADDVPAIANHGVEVSSAANTFLTIVSHTLSGSTSTITLSAAPAPGDIPNLRVQIGMTGHAATRDPATIPRTTIRTQRTAYRAFATGVLRHRHALHQRLSVTAA